MNVSAEAAVALPTRLRPTPDQVCNWYARTLAAMGAEVERTGSGQLEFSLRWSHTFFDSSLPSSLAPLSGGQLEVSETADGFEVSVDARARNWVGFLPIALAAFTTGGLAAGTAIGTYMAFVAVGLLGFTWMRTWGSLNHFLDATNGAIVDSFAAVPPTPHPAPLTPHAGGAPKSGPAPQELTFSTTSEGVERGQE